MDFETYKLPSFIQLNNEISEPLLKSNQIKKMRFWIKNFNKNILNEIKLPDAISIKIRNSYFSKTSIFENHKK